MAPTPYLTIDELEAMGFGFIGRNVKLFRHSIIVNPANIHLGHGCQIDDHVHIIAGQKLHIGNRVHIGCHSSILGGGSCVLADYSGLSSGCRLVTGTDDFHGHAMTNPCVPPEYRAVRRGSLTLGKHVIVGCNTVILADSHIGEGAAIGAASLVSGDLAPWTIYAGTPACAKKARTSETILRMERELVERHGY